MAVLSYESLSFKEAHENLTVILSGRFYLKISRKQLNCKVEADKLIFDCPEKQAERKFLSEFTRALPTLRSITTKNPAVYVHRDSGIPLIGSSYFGIIYRNTSIIEVKPQTSCNLDCIYCSVGEGINSRQTDFLVERSYLVEEFQKLAKFAGVPVEAHIGVQGEPLLYAEFLDLVKDLSEIKEVKKISADTNGTLLTKRLIDALSQYNLRLNISLNAIDPAVARRLAGVKYNSRYVMEMIRYASQKMDVLVAPLYVPGVNDDEIIKVIEFCKTLPNLPIIGIQNFLNYKTGRNPVKALGWDAFTNKLKEWETETGIRLLLDFKKDFSVEEARELPKPFNKGDVIKARVLSLGRYNGTRIVASQGRNITIYGCSEAVGNNVKVRITRDKHNIYSATVKTP